MRVCVCFIAAAFWLRQGMCRDEEKIMKACYWHNERYEPCFAGCAEVSCDNPRNHLRPCYPYCEPGCICEDPYVRDDRTHQCVLPQECSPTQMGIPVASNKKPPLQKHIAARPEIQQSLARRGGPPTPMDYENDIPPPVLHVEEPKRAEVSRMGNYFNIVIAPPPIKAIHPRKMLQNDVYKSHIKRHASITN